MNEALTIELAKAHPLFQALPHAVVEQLVSASKVLRLRPKRTVLRERDAPESAYFLLQGAVRVFHREGSTEYLLKLFQAPALFGEMEVMTQRPFIENVATLTSSELLAVPAAVFTSLVDTHPKFGSALAYDLASRLCIAAHNLRALAFGDLRSRLAHLLLDYADFFGLPSEDGKGLKLDLSLSQAMMAKDLAVSRKAINDTLSELKRMGLVDKEDARYLLRDPAKLKALGTGVLSLAYQSQKTQTRGGPPEATPAGASFMNALSAFRT